MWLTKNTLSIYRMLKLLIIAILAIFALLHVARAHVAAENASRRGYAVTTDPSDWIGDSWDYVLSRIGNGRYRRNPKTGAYRDRRNGFFYNPKDNSWYDKDGLFKGPDNGEMRYWNIRGVY
jgi:hypothetical protein